MPFEKATEVLEPFWGVQVSGPPARRMTQRVGASAEAVQTAERTREPETVVRSQTTKMAISADGASLSLLGGEWAEVQTLAMGDVGALKKRRGTHEVEVNNLSSFSRMASASAFGDVAQAERQPRGVARLRPSTP